MFFCHNWEISTKNLVTFKRWMGLRIKNLKNHGGSLKNPVFKGGLTKSQYIWGDCLKKQGAWTTCRFKKRI